VVLWLEVKTKCFTDGSKKRLLFVSKQETDGFPTQSQNETVLVTNMKLNGFCPKLRNEAFFASK